MELKDLIAQTKAEHPDYGLKRIAKIVGCDFTTVKYHLSDSGKSRVRRNRAIGFKQRLNILRTMFGGKCSQCGYCKCVAALEFHHRDPSTKKGNVVTLLKNSSMKAALEEARKCDLVCANCHREKHEQEGFVNIEGKRKEIGPSIRLRS